MLKAEGEPQNKACLGGGKKGEDGFILENFAKNGVEALVEYGEMCSSQGFVWNSRV
jgi:hypothetical protein